MLKPVHDRALYALGRIRRYRRLTPHEGADYLALLDIASRRPWPQHERRALAAGFDPARVGTVPCRNRVALSDALGLGQNSETLGRRLTRYAELGIAADHGDVIILRPGGVVRLDDHRAAYETDAELADGQPFPVVHLPRGKAPATGGAVAPAVAPGQIDLRFGGSPGDPGGSPGDPLTVYKRDDEAGGGAPAFTRSTLPDLDEPEGFDALATLAEDVAQPLPDGRPFQLTRHGRRRLIAIVERHGLAACRSTLETGGDYRIEHPVGWLDATLEQRSKPAPPPEPEPAELDPLEAELIACIPEVEGRPKRRRLSVKSRDLLAALIAAHGDQALRAALPDAADWHWPVQRLQAVLAGDARRPQARSKPPEDFPWRKRKAEREARLRAELTIGRYEPPPTPEDSAARAQRLEEQARRAEASRAAEAARHQREAERVAHEQAAAERRAEEARRRREAERPRVRAKLGELAALVTQAAGSGVAA